MRSSEATPDRVALAVPVDAARDHLRGGQPPGAATLVEYGDYECPYSRLAYRSVQRVEGRLGDRLRFVFRHFPLRDKHPHAQLAAEAAEEAGAQGRFWELHDAMFSRQRALELQDLRGYALELGIDVAALDAALGDGRHRPRIEDDIDGARRSGVQGTPTLFIEGVPYGGSYEPDDLELALRTASRG